MKRRIAAGSVGLIVALSGLMVMFAAPAQAAARLKTGKYSCWNYAVYPAWPTGSIKFNRDGTYVTPIGATSPGARGTWRHNPDRDVIKFPTGPFRYDNLKMKHLIIDGSHWTRMLVRTNGSWEYSYSCYWYR